jgi:SAM-dependent methyltransferase
MTDAYITWKGWGEADFGHFTRDEEIYFAEELRASGVHTLAGLKFAELGYGNGTFAGWVRKAGADWTGREALPELSDRAQRAGFAAIGHDLALSSLYGQGQADVVVAFDVLEHLEVGSIRSFLVESHEALKPGGLLIARVPSGDSPFSGAIYRGDLTHRTTLGSGAVRQLARESGFDVLQLRAPVLPLRGFGPLRLIRRTVVSLLQRIGYWFVRHFLMGHGTAVVAPNMVLVLKKAGPRP